VAKGNDGNYLQHSIEVELAVHLAARDPRGRLHIALTHGMAPYEPCDMEPGQMRSVLDAALSAGGASRRRNEISLVTAYRRTKARADHYPNSATLLAGMLGADHLSGGITETDPAKQADLEVMWAGADVKTAQASWRSEARLGGILFGSPHLDTPWLFSMDPMTYKEAGRADDCHLYRADLDQLVETVDSFVASGQPGVAALFVYGIMAKEREKFWTFVNELAEWTGTTVESCWMKHHGGNRNLCGLLCSNFSLSTSWLPEHVHAGQV
jgi:hypothetical protein